jgi:hypothetical protein
MFLLKTRGGSLFSERTAQLEGIADAASGGPGQLTQDKRTELVRAVLDLLDGRKKANRQNNPKEKGDGV